MLFLAISQKKKFCFPRICNHVHACDLKETDPILKVFILLSYLVLNLTVLER